MQDKSDLLLFIGRFHPLIVHLPIGLLSLQPVLELAAWKFKKPGLDTACRINLGLCAPADAPVGTAPLTDGAPLRATELSPRFPYLNAPIPGSPN